MMRIGLTYDLISDQPLAPGDPSDLYADYDRPETIERLCQALSAAGHEPIPIGDRDKLIARLSNLPCELVLNLAEGRFGRTRESEVPILLEWAKIPYVGSDPLTLAIALDKELTKQLLAKTGIQTPPAFTGQFPAIVKPRFGGSGMGIGPGAVVKDLEALSHRIALIETRYRQSAMVEAFIPGYEFTVAILGTGKNAKALPVMQRSVERTTQLASHLWQDLADDQLQELCEVSPEIEERLTQQALTAYCLLGVRDFGRVDLRRSPEGKIYLLEVNPLPSLAPHDTFGILAESLGWGYDRMIAAIIEGAQCRYGLTPSPISI